jgi:hypothetical protein
MEVVKMEVDKTETKKKCAKELANVHNNLISRRFLTMLSNREEATGKPLTDEEIEDLKVRFDAEIYRELLMTRAGK